MNTLVPNRRCRRFFINPDFIVHGLEVALYVLDLISRKYALHDIDRNIRDHVCEAYLAVRTVQMELTDEIKGGV